METTIVQSPVAAFLARYLYYLLLAILVLNLTQRKHMATGRKKRLATLYLALAVLLTMGICALMVRFALPDLLLLGVALVLGLVGYQYRGYLFPFRSRCPACSARLTFDRIAYHDSNLCPDCQGNGGPAAGPPAE